MPAFDVANSIRDALDDIKAADLDDPRLMEVLSLAENLVDTMKLFFGAMDHSVLDEFQHIGKYIMRTREEIAALRPNDIHGSRIPTAGAELEAVVGDTERATEKIMTLAEDIMSADDSDPAAFRAKIDDSMMQIIEACSFQDITGQRVSKVVATLTHIEERVARFSEVMGVMDAESEQTDKEKWQSENFLNGPQIDGPATGQDAIDALFDGDADEASLGQDDIDNMFD
ncbi:COG3143: Chemotaxis protein [hydrothermal vent metagenome]|uniref:COG3143: Chemotaxis protein n=1 Tax=hydrothermal vent metagenome TaxID=652676 RepID=A0A3B0REA6_9ZZZZ